MNAIPQKDKELLEAIRNGETDAWSKLIQQYQGSLLNFAKSRLPQQADAEDVVQNTFISFVRGINDFREESGLHSYLFAILQNQIYSSYRTRRAKSICLLQDIYGANGHTGLDEVLIDGGTPSQYLWRDEQKQILAQTIKKMITKYKASMNFQSLKMADMLFYCNIDSPTTAKLLEVNSSTVRTFKYRFIKEVHEHISSVCSPAESSPEQFEDILTEIWESQRLSCPRRNTIAAFLSENLDVKWFDYVDFHITTIGCHFCRAELKDLMVPNRTDQQLQEKIFASTVGFFTK